MPKRALTIAAVCLVVAAGMSACVKSRTTNVYTTDTTTKTVGQSPEPTGPVDTRKLVAADSPGCPVLSASDALQIGGMRLARVQTLTRGTSVVGCRFFGVQGTYTNEHLPGPNQPVIEILSTRYRTALDAHNALAVAATKGTEANQYDVAPKVVGVAYRTAFDPADNGQDWAFGFSKGATLVIVRTVTTKTSQVALELAQAVYPRI